MAKINLINSGALDIIRTAYYILGLELMKLIFAVLDVSLTMGLTHCYKTEVFLHLPVLQIHVGFSINVNIFGMTHHTLTSAVTKHATDDVRSPPMFVRL